MIHPQKRLILFLLILSTFSFLMRQAVDPSTAAPVEQQVHQYLSRLASFGYSFGVLIEKDGKILHHQVYDRSGAPAANKQIVFNLASVSKQFTAAAILLLEEQGRLKVMDSIGNYLPDVPEAMKEITIHHLLTHSSGIIDDYDLYDSRPVLTRSEFMKSVFSRKTGFSPGLEMEYSNDGYALLAAIVEFTSKKTFESFVHDNLFSPAGMKGSVFVGETIPGVPIALPHGGFYEHAVNERSWSGALGASNVLSNVEELSRWDNTLRTGRILSKDSLHKMWQPQIKGPANLSYGYGWWIRKTEEEKQLIFHSGREGTGFNAWCSRYPEDNVYMYLTSNTSVCDYPFREALFSATGSGNLERIVFRKPAIMPPETLSVPADDLNQLAGRYRLISGGWFEVKQDSGGLLIIPHGQDAFDLLIPQSLNDQLDFYKLLNIDPGWSADIFRKVSIATEQTAEILQDFRSGKDAAYKRYTEDPEERSLKFLKAAEAFEVLGTTVLTKSQSTMRLVTVVRAWNENSERLYYFNWRDGRIVQLFPASDPFPIPLFRKSPGKQFVNFHPFLQGSAGVEFQNKGERNMRMVIGTGDQSAVAVR